MLMTEIWRSIKNEEDIAQLQRDINILYFWSLNNKMKFHPDKCKVLTIIHKPFLLAIFFIEKLRQLTHVVGTLSHKGIARRALPASGVKGVDGGGGGE